MRPDRQSHSPVKRISQGVVEVEMRIDRGADGNFAHRLVGVHLKGSADRRLKSLDQHGRVASDDEPAVRSCLQALAAIGNGGVHSVADFADGGEAPVSHRLFGHSRVGRHSLVQRRQRQKPGSGVGHAKAGSGAEKASPRHRLRAIFHDLLRTETRKSIASFLAGYSTCWSRCRKCCGEFSGGYRLNSGRSWHGNLENSGFSRRCAPSASRAHPEWSRCIPLPCRLCLSVPGFS